MDVSRFKQIIENYEYLVIELTNELKTLKSEHEDLKSKLPTIVKENKQLLKQLNEYANCKRNRESICDSEIIKNLREQINLLLEEKDDTKNLHQKAVESIELLEKELKMFKSENLELLPKQQFLQMKELYEEKLKKLENRLKSIQSLLEEKQTEVQDAEKSKDNKIKHIQQLDTKIDNLRYKICELEKSNEELRNNIYEKEKQVKSTMLKNSDYREKVNEALQVVQAALNEKDAALLREAAAKSEIQTLNEELDKIVEEIKEKFNRDIAKVKEDDKQKYDLLLNEFNKNKEELKLITLEVEKYQTKSIILQSEIDKLLSGGLTSEESQISKLLVLEKNLEATFQKLLLSEKQNIQIKSDYEGLKNDLEQMATYYERTLKSKEVERLSFQNSINQLQSFIKEKDLNIKALNNEIERLKQEIISTKKEYTKHVENLDQQIDTIKRESTEKQRKLYTKLDKNEKLNKKLISGTKDSFMLAGVGVDLAFHRHRTGYYLIGCSTFVLIAEVTWVVTLFLQICVRNDHKVWMCWAGVSWFSDWKKSVIYTPMSVIPFLWPHNLWLSYVAGGQLLALSLFHLVLTFKTRKKKKRRKDRLLNDGDSFESSKFEEITECLDDGLPEPIPGSSHSISDSLAEQDTILEI